MLFTPATNQRSKRGLYGVVTSSGASGPWMRRLSFPVQTNTPPAVNWRHIFLTTKNNYAALAPGGTGYVLTDGIAPQQAWAILAATYFGIFEPVLNYGFGSAMGRLIGCSSPDTFYSMCQANAASLGFAPVPTPALTGAQVAPPAANVFTTYGAQTVGTAPAQPSQPDPSTAPLTIVMSDTGSNGWLTSAVISGAPSGVSATWDDTGTDTTYFNTPDSSACDLNMTVHVPTGQAAGPCNLTLSFTAGGSPQTQTLAFVITNNGVQLVTPCPFFAFPTSMGCQTILDSSMNVTGFLLNYVWVGSYTYPMYRFGVGIPGIWEITASPAYSSSYSPPDPASWQPILFSGPNLPAATDVLTAWTSLFGDLPAAGNIKFQAAYIDPTTCASGPALSCSATWDTGTLKGASLASWSGPKFELSGYPGTFNITVPDTLTLSAVVYGVNGYGGTLTPSVKCTYEAALNTIENTNGLPPGIVFTLSPASLTIAPGDTGAYTLTATAPVAAGIEEYNLNLTMSVKDGIQTSGYKTTFILTGSVVRLPVVGAINIDPYLHTYASPNPGTGAVTYTLSNSTPDDVTVTMSAICDDPTAVVSFDTVSFVVPGGAIGSPGTATCNLSITLPGTQPSTGDQIQVKVDAGTLTTYAALTLA